MNDPETRTFGVDPSDDARRTALLEAFLAYCRECLFADGAAPVRALLAREHGLHETALAAGPIGLYAGGREVRLHLLALGFTREEIRLSTVAGDARLAGRLVVPWRDARGRLHSIAALDSRRETSLRSSSERSFVPAIGEHSRADASGVLYLRGSRRPVLFGLDVALRCPAHGPLILVHSMLDVLYLQSIGIHNAVSPGRWPITAAAFREMCRIVQRVQEEEQKERRPHEQRAVTPPTPTPQPRESNPSAPDSWPVDDDIRLAAYLLWQRLGCPVGRDDELWHTARQSLLEQCPDTIPFFRPVRDGKSSPPRRFTAADRRSACGRTRAA